MLALLAAAFLGVQLPAPASSSCISMSSTLNRHIGFANIARDGSFQLFIVAILADDEAAAGIQGAEFRLDDYPQNWFFQATVNPAALMSSGNMMDNGVRIWFSNCQQAGANRMIWLYTLNGVATSNFQGEIRIRSHLFPSNPTFACPTLMVTTCSRPSFIQVCVPDCVFCVNPGGGACTTAVEETHWSSVKEMYR